MATFIENSRKQLERKEAAHLAIVDDKDEYLGTVSLKNIDKKAKDAEYAISLRSAYHGKGIGKIATRLILEYAFDELGLSRVYLNVLSDNVRAIALYEKCGFQFEREEKDCLKIKGKTVSLKWYSITNGEGKIK